MTLKQLFGNIADNAAQLTSKALGQERISQYANKDPMNGYACFFTCYFMWFRTVNGYSKTWEQYKADCLKIGAINSGFKIISKQKMVEAAGYTLSACETSARMREKIYELLLIGRPVIFALDGGRHFESIDGFKSNSGSEIIFTIDDPGPNNDTWASAESLKVYSASGKVSGAITKIYWME